MARTLLHMAQPPSASVRLASAIRGLLDTHDVSQRQAAEQTGIPEATLRRRLTGNSPFDSNELDALAHVFGLTLVELVTLAECAA